jgi:hypothetical protein
MRTTRTPRRSPLLGKNLRAAISAGKTRRLTPFSSISSASSLSLAPCLVPTGTRYARLYSEDRKADGTGGDYVGDGKEEPVW